VSLLTIAQAVADDIGLDVRPVSVMGNPDADAQRLMRFAARVGSDLAARAPWQALRLVTKFGASGGEMQGGAIPAAFLRFSPETLWDESHGLTITGPVDATEYQARKYNMADGSAVDLSTSTTLIEGEEIYTSTTSIGFVTGSSYAGPMRWFTRRANALLIWPPPPVGTVISFAYQSGAYCESAAGDPQAAWLADTDTGRISEELITLGMIYRFLNADGQPYQQAQADYERRLSREIASDAPSARVLASADIFAVGSSRFTGEPTSPTGRYY